MRRVYKFIIMIILSIVVFISCVNKNNQPNQESLSTNNRDKLEDGIHTVSSEASDSSWCVENLITILNLSDDMDILLEEYYDFNDDGIDELIIAFGYKIENGKNYVDDIFYVGVNNGEYEIYSHLEDLGYGYFSVDLIYLSDKKQPVLYCKTTNYANLVGFELYEIQNNSFNQLVYSVSATGVGHDEMLDLDGDGIYTGYLQKRQSYDSLYTVMYRHYGYVDGEFILDDISADFYNYPLTAEGVVLEYLNMHSIINEEDIGIPDIKSRLKELCPRNFKPPNLYDYEDMIEYNIMLESPFILRTETFEESNITYVYQEHKSDDNIPTVVYSLGQYDGKWEIYDYRLIGGKRKELSDRIDIYFKSYVFTEINHELLTKYKEVLLNEIAIIFEYVVTEGRQSYTLENISYDGFWMKPIRFSLVDMNQDLIPELIVEGSLGSAGFVLVIREVDNEMIAHEFSHRQMYDLKKDGSFGATGGAAYSGYFTLEFDDMTYHIKRIAETDTEEDKDGNLKSIFYIGETLTDEDEFWIFWENLQNKESADWIDFEIDGDMEN